jgi:hypothetical protein
VSGNSRCFTLKCALIYCQAWERGKLEAAA